MEHQVERVAGLDVHRKTIAVCVRIPGDRGERVQHIRTFGTTAVDLLVLRDWLEAHHVTQVAMESTGVYWKAVFYVLEESMECVLVNPQHVQKVPGRKSDVQDCVWLAQLLEHGLLRGSFVPPPPQRELRDLTRYRKVLIQERTREANRLHKVLEDAGIKLATVATDILGVSGRAMLHALIDGTTDPDVLADLARGTLRKKLPALRQALVGRFRPHHAFMVSQHLGHLDYLDEAIDALSHQIEEALRPFEVELTRLDSLPGVGRRTAEVVLAEVGVDMQRFPTAANLASWAGLCPGQDESARYHRIRRHRGHKKAVVAVARALLVTAYHLLDRQQTYRDLGPDYFDRRYAERATRRAVRTLERQGYRVTLDPAA
jgi:transposase